jgi:putative photosynthetic complex assembly protein 2
MNWAQLWLPVAITTFTWWFSTGLILLLVRLPRKAHTLLLIGYGGIAILAVWGLIGSAQTLTPNTIYCGFVCALLIWGWHEASFLMGKITGPRPKACPPDCVGWQRFGYATATLIYHEVALFVTLMGIAALTWNSPNQISLWIFGLLFVMRLSAKFNIFLGVPNLTDEFFPQHLAHLKSYLPKRAMNPLMPISLIASAFLALWMWQKLAAAQGDQTAFAIVLTLTCLGILEHLFMITPLPDAALWRWAVKVQPASSTANEAASGQVAGPLKKSDNG